VGEGAQTAALTQERPGVVRLEFTSPASISGFTLRLEGDAASLGYNGLQTNIPATSLPQSGAVMVLGQALEQLSRPAGKKGLRRLSGGGWERKGAINGQPYTASLSAEGALRSLKAPGLELKID
jgi:hypothetical protein